MTMTKDIYKITAAVMLLLSAGVSGATAQKTPEEESTMQFRQVEKTLLWAGSKNAAGLSFMNFPSISYAEGFYSKNDGDFVKYYNSNDSYNLGLRTESYTRVNKVVFYGMLEYDNFRGHNMTYSGFIHPERYMIGLADDLPRDKRSETYTLKGGIAAPVHKNLVIGGRVNYQTADLAKMRDLRHKTKLLDFEIIPGVMYKTEYVNIGVNYIYHKFHEKVEFSAIAPDQQVPYNGYYLKGLFFGMQGIFSESGLNMSRPVVDVINGVSGQMEIGVAKNLQILGEFTYKTQKGRSGAGKDNSLTENNGDHYLSYLKIAHSAKGFRQYLTLNTNYTDAKNYDNVYTTVKIGGISTIIQLGKSIIFSQRTFDINAVYELALGDKAYNPSWVINVGAGRYSRSSVSSLLNPIYYTQTVHCENIWGSVKKNFTWGKNMIDVTALIGAGRGKGDKLNQRVSNLVESEFDEELLPMQYEYLFEREWEFLTATKFNGMAGVRYSYLMTKKMAGNSAYVDVKYEYMRGKNIKIADGKDARVIKLTLGMNF